VCSEPFYLVKAYTLFSFILIIGKLRGHKMLYTKEEREELKKKIREIDSLLKFLEKNLEDKKD